DLRVAALQRAFALAEMDAPARPVAEDLHLEVPGLWQEALHIDLGIAEGGLGLAPAGLPGLLDLVGLRDDAHAAPAAAGHGLDHHRAACRKAREEFARFLEPRGMPGAFEDRHAQLARPLARAGLVAEQRERLGRGADEDEARRLDPARELGILGEEAVAGVDGVGL